jgi:polysaccharide pyruvyl transferase WcaK-like protein
LDYPGLMRDLIRHFQQKRCEVHLVPHVIVPSGRMVMEDDARASVALAAEFPGTVLAPSFTSPSQAKTYIAGMDFFMGARMHACIAAFSSGVPVVPMAYSRKFEGLFGSIGYRRTVDCTKEDGATILGKIAQAFDERVLLKQEAEAALTQGKARLELYETALGTLMRQVIKRKNL